MTTTTRPIRRPRAIAALIIYLATRRDSGTKEVLRWEATTSPRFRDPGAPARVPRQGAEHPGPRGEQDPRRRRGAPVRVPRRARAGRDGVRISDPSPRRGV